LLTFFHTRKKDEREYLTKILTELLVPVYSRLNTLNALHRVLRKGKPKDFRLLIHLADPDHEYDEDGQKVKLQLNESDRELVDDIVQIESELERIILDKAGLTEN